VRSHPPLRLRPMTGAADPSGECDLAVVGAGILGLAVAREALRRRPGLEVRVLEREDRVGVHQTGHNSGVVHAGIYYVPGSLKARLCVDGARELYDYCDERGVHADRCGKLIVATDESELPRLDELERRGRENRVPGLRRVSAREIAEIEPHVRGLAALHSPATGVVDFAAVARALAEDVERAGGRVATSCEVSGAARRNGRIELRHARGETRARRAVVCAGLWSDRLAVRMGAPPDPRIVPFRGAYLKLRPERSHLVRALIYPVPDPTLPFLGVHLSRHHDDVLVGPTALLVGARDAYRLARVRLRDVATTLAWPGTWRMMRRWWRTGVVEMRHAASRRAVASEAARFVPELRPGDLRAGTAGVRAQALGRDGRLLDDFAFSETDGALHVRNAPSPAATASLAIARMVVDRAEEGLA
jgi:(S)-2-hydroxyglutarate dehydrogenase